MRAGLNNHEFFARAALPKRKTHEKVGVLHAFLGPGGMNAQRDTYEITPIMAAGPSLP